MHELEDVADALVLGHPPERQSDSSQFEPSDEEERTRFDKEDHDPCCG
jgi:hypothetical protein